MLPSAAESALVSTHNPLLAAGLDLPLPRQRLAQVLRRVLRERVLRLARMLLVGFAASVVDLAILTCSVRALHLDATLSRLIALVVSGLLLFVGSRGYAFRAQAGSLSRQAKWFTLTEVAGLGLNLLAFRWLCAQLPWAAPEFVSLASNFAVFAVFSYPARRALVFRLPAPSLAPAA
jgi:putative flippase GtrA